MIENIPMANSVDLGRDAIEDYDYALMKPKILSSALMGWIRRCVQTEKSRDEILRRYDESLKLLRRCIRVFRKASWEDGETENDVSEDVNHFLGFEALEKEIGVDAREGIG